MQKLLLALILVCAASTALADRPLPDYAGDRHYRKIPVTCHSNERYLDQSRTFERYADRAVDCDWKLGLSWICSNSIDVHYDGPSAKTDRKPLSAEWIEYNCDGGIIHRWYTYQNGKWIFLEGTDKQYASYDTRSRSFLWHYDLSPFPATTFTTYENPDPSAFEQKNWPLGGLHFTACSIGKGKVRACGLGATLGWQSSGKIGLFLTSPVGFRVYGQMEGAYMKREWHANIMPFYTTSTKQFGIAWVLSGTF